MIKIYTNSFKRNFGSIPQQLLRIYLEFWNSKACLYNQEDSIRLDIFK